MDSDNNQVKELVEEKETNRKAPAMQLSLAALKSKTNAELFEIAQSLGISGYSRKRKNDLVFEILRKSAESKGYLFSEGILEITPEGYGFLSTSDDFSPSDSDFYVSPSQFKRFMLSV